MIITDHLTHKVLPVIFARGYLGAVETPQGRGQFTACYQGAAHRRDPGKHVYERKAWMEPLYAYVGVGTTERQDLDYFYVRLLYEGLTMQASGEMLSLPPLTRKMGRAWWFGMAPRAIGVERYSFHTLLAPNILRALDEWKFGSPQINHKNFKPSHELIVLALELFTSALQTQAHIDCQLEREPQRLVFRVQDCSCCTAQSPQCHIFIGVLEAFLIWLHGNPDEPKTLTLNEAESTGHTIVLDVPPIRSAVPSP